MSEEKGKFERTKKLREALKKGAAKPTPAQTPCPVCGLPLRMLVAGDEEPHCGNRNCPNFKGTFEDAVKTYSGGPLSERDKKMGRELAAAANPVAPKKTKNNHRTAKARDLRAKMKGRMPVNLQVFAEWDGKKWLGKLYALTVPPGVEGTGGDIVNDLEYEAATMPKRVKAFFHQADGLFRLMEEMDCMFWEWFAKEATADQKARLTFAPDPPVPAPWPIPPTSEGTAPESR